MAVKRRIVWFDDEEWAALQAEAKSRHTNITGVLRIHWQLAAAEHRVQATTGLTAHDVLSRVSRSR